MAQCLRSVPSRVSATSLFGKSLECGNPSYPAVISALPAYKKRKSYALECLEINKNSLMSLNYVKSKIAYERTTSLQNVIALHHNMLLLTNHENLLSYSPPTPKIDTTEVPCENRTSNEKPPLSDRPTPEQIQIVHDTLKANLPMLFVKPQDYRLFHLDVVLYDNIRKKIYKGLVKYIGQVALLRVVGHLKYAYVSFNILNMSMFPDEGRVSIRWQIKGISGLRVMFKFWKYKLWKYEEIKNSREIWYDGVAHFDVNNEGKIFQVTVDKVIENRDPELDNKNKIPLFAKIAALIALFPQQFDEESLLNLLMKAQFTDSYSLGMGTMP